jgi:hypothetical protein
MFAGGKMMSRMSRFFPGRAKEGTYLRQAGREEAEDEDENEDEDDWLTPGGSQKAEGGRRVQKLISASIHVIL